MSGLAANAVNPLFSENNQRLRKLLFSVIPKIGRQRDDVFATALRGGRL